MTKQWAFLAPLLACGAMALGQGNLPAPSQPVAPRSPVVQADSTVTFHLLAPTASTVVLDGDHPIGDGYRNGKKLTPMIKDDQGVWSVKVGPLEPDFYSYYFLVDGVRMPDPQNVRLIRDGVRYANWAVVPGAVSASYEINDVPHGTVSEVWYPSPALGMTRRLTVYTPPGYESGGRRYPVLYLIHGGGGDEQAWVDMGRAPEIFDNLIAQGKMTPAIVVIPNANEWEQTSPNDKPVTAPRGGPSGQILQFPESLVKDLIPYVDKTYRTEADAQHRAIAGLSRGGAQALYAAMNNLNDFAGWACSAAGCRYCPRC
jgi:enterochelin esterase family protein